MPSFRFVFACMRTFFTLIFLSFSVNFRIFFFNAILSTSINSDKFGAKKRAQKRRERKKDPDYVCRLSDLSVVHIIFNWKSSVVSNSYVEYSRIVAQPTTLSIKLSSSDGECGSHLSQLLSRTLFVSLSSHWFYFINKKKKSDT